MRTELLERTKKKQKGQRLPVVLTNKNEKMIYRRLRRTWTNNTYHHIPKFNKVFPELKSIDSEEMIDRFIELGLDFYIEEEKTISPLIRITLPFAIILMGLMFLSLPIVYVITGYWGYAHKDRNAILNWFRMLGLD